MRIFRFCLVVLLLSILCRPASQLRAQQSQSIISPEINSQHRVTFRLFAPNAKQVGLNAQFAQGIQPMTKDSKGIWHVTVGPVNPEIYEYTFIVDGLHVVDPSNSWLKVWLRNAKNLVEIPGDETNRETRYPVLYLFHGYGDSADAWTVVGRANFIMDNLVAKNKVKPFIIVMPYGHTPASPPVMQSIGRYDAYEKDLVEDIIPYVRKCYRVSAGQKDRAIAGLSMGGGQSLTIGLGNLDLFGWVGAFNSAISQEQKLDKLLEKPESINEKLELLWIGCGRKDFLFEANQKFLERLKTEKIKHVGHITEGAHEWRIWRNYLNELAPLLFKED